MNGVHNLEFGHAPRRKLDDGDALVIGLGLIGRSQGRGQQTVGRRRATSGRRFAAHVDAGPDDPEPRLPIDDEDGQRRATLERDVDPLRGRCVPRALCGLSRRAAAP